MTDPTTPPDWNPLIGPPIKGDFNGPHGHLPTEAAAHGEKQQGDDGTDPARPHRLAWNGTEWVAPCGCRYHPDDDNGSHGGAPHVHRCETHTPAEQTVAYPHFSDVLTNEVIDGIADRAIESGDLILAMRCAHAKTDDLAMRDLAITLEEKWANRSMTEEDRAGLDPGIAWLVTALHTVGFHTCDSGDGANWEKGMTCALPYRHVVIMCAPWHDPKAETQRVARYLAWIGADDEFEAVLTESEGPNDHSPGVIFVADKRAEEIMEEVGYVPPTLEELTCGEDDDEAPP